MIAWRLCRRRQSDLSDEGSRLFGGRWNSAGRPVVYLAEHPALAALEVRVHLDLPFELLPADHVLMHVSVPVAPVAGFDLPIGTAALGDTWLARARSAAQRVRSVLVPRSWNMLLNPLHPDAAQAGILADEPFGFDPRLWRPLAGEG